MVHPLASACSVLRGGKRLCVLPFPSPSSLTLLFTVDIISVMLVANYFPIGIFKAICRDRPVVGVHTLCG